MVVEDDRWKVFEVVGAEEPPTDDDPEPDSHEARDTFGFRLPGLLPMTL